MLAQDRTEFLDILENRVDEAQNGVCYHKQKQVSWDIFSDCHDELGVDSLQVDKDDAAHVWELKEMRMISHLFSNDERKLSQKEVISHVYQFNQIR